MNHTINRREFIKMAGAGIGALTLNGLLGCGAESQSGEQPNIVILFADDLGYGDLSCYGHPTIQTPNLDRMADEGIRLTSFYAQPSCSPSRASLLTGKYPLRASMPHVLGPNSDHALPQSEVTLTEGLKSQGYQTQMVGKWHLGHAEEEHLPTSRGFDHYFGLLYSNDMKPPWVNTEKPLELYRDTEPIEHPVNQDTLTTRYTEESVQFIENASSDAPFFLYMAYSMPHLPLHTADTFRETSRAGLYGDIIETIDWSAGQILQAIKDKGVDDNTIVVFTSDNGPWSNMPPRMLQEGIRPWHAGWSGLLRGAKHMTYEGGPRVPGIVRWPEQIPAGQESADIASTMDVFTTMMNLGGAEVPADVDGKDLLAFLKGESESPAQQFYYFSGNTIHGVRDAEWKLRIAEGYAELFNLDIDPAERHNRAEELPDIVSRLQALIEDKAQETDADLPEA
jgi:arylsulfatase A-like enzyme